MYSIIMDAHKGKPLYLVVADVKEAYDNVWRDALWAKLATSHNCMEEVRSARALYAHMDAQTWDSATRGVSEACSS